MMMTNKVFMTDCGVFHRMVEMLTGSVNSTLVIGSNKLGTAAPSDPADGLPSPSTAHMVHSAASASITPVRKAVETSL